MALSEAAAVVPRGAALAIIAALPSEARSLARLAPRGSARLGDGARLRLSGMGAARAASAAEQLIAEGASALVSWGTAAALAPGIDPGALILPADILDREGRRWPTDPGWRECLAARLGPRHTLYEGTLAEAAGMLESAAAKAGLHAASGAVAADMESAAIAAVAAAHGVRFIAIRAVIDDARISLPPVARAAMDADGRLRPLALLAALVGRPTSVHAQLRTLKQLAVAFRAARMSLADAAGALLAGTPS